jgi:hypothetical protein
VDYRASSSLDIYEIDTAVTKIAMIQILSIFEIINFKITGALLAYSGFLHNCERVFDLL